jgi:hypothetical protein
MSLKIGSKAFNGSRRGRLPSIWATSTFHGVSISLTSQLGSFWSGYYCIALICDTIYPGFFNASKISRGARILISTSSKDLDIGQHNYFFWRFLWDHCSDTLNSILRCSMFYFYGRHFPSHFLCEFFQFVQLTSREGFMQSFRPSRRINKPRRILI